MKTNKAKEYVEREQESDDKVWYNYKQDQLDWLGHFYALAGQRGQKALKKASIAFQQLEEKLKQSHYNKYNRYFMVFAERQDKKYFRMKPLFPQIYLQDYEYDSEIEFKENSETSLLDAPMIKRYRVKLFHNFKTVLQVLTHERYKFSNVAKHILRNKQGSSDSEIETQGIIVDIERGKKVDWKNVHAGLLLVFIRSVSKGFAELQSKLIFHCDIKESNILLYNCQNISDLFDPIKLANIIDKIQFKIIDFDHALLLDSEHLNNTINLIKLKDKIKEEEEEDIDLQYNITMSDIVEMSKDIKNWIKTKHSKKIITCIENIAKLVKGDSQQVRYWIQMIEKHDDGLVSKIEKRIHAFKSNYK